MYPAYLTTRPDMVLAYPHYSDSRWNKPQLLYSDGSMKTKRPQRLPKDYYSDSRCAAYAESETSFDFRDAPETDECNYSDRLQQWDYAKAEAASKGLDLRTAAGIEQYLSRYHDKPVRLRYVLGGVNLSNGYTYYVYGYDYITNPEEKS